MKYFWILIGIFMAAILQNCLIENDEGSTCNCPVIPVLEPLVSSTYTEIVVSFFYEFEVVSIELNDATAKIFYRNKDSEELFEGHFEVESKELLNRDVY